VSTSDGLPADLRLAVAAHRKGDFETAEALYRAVLARGPNYDALGNLGVVLGRRGAIEEAEALLSRAVALAPDRAAHRKNLGRLLHRTGRLAEAAAALEAALAVAPDDLDARQTLAPVYLALGRAEGWALYDLRPERQNTPAKGLSFPEWQGEPLAGRRLYVMGEQGLGDQLFAARYLSQLGAADVTVACAPALARLFAQLPAEIQVRHGRLEVARHDFWTLPMSLPRWAQAGPVPYLAATPRRTGGIGVVWRGNQAPDPGRSLPPDQAARLLALPGAMSLHPEDSGVDDMLGTAEIIAGLDVVLTIDTSVAHLAGALGRPAIVLLQHYQTDWRWRETTPGRSFWYPSLELARQPAPGDWAGLIDAVVARFS
jgi:tetratricopeptide (TPR) repeat protein